MNTLGAMDWNTIYLTCFGVGLVLSVLAFVTGFGHLHLGHWHFHGHGTHGHAHHGGAGISPVNGFTLVAFLCWFGGTGYLLHRAGIFGGLLVLLFSVISGMSGGALVFWFMARVLMSRERPLEPADTEMTGVIGRLSAPVTASGFGEMLYSQNGARRSVAVRSLDGDAISRGEEVIVMRYERGVAHVRRWDEFEHGLLGASGLVAGRNEEQGAGTRE